MSNRTERQTDEEHDRETERPGQVTGWGEKEHNRQKENKRREEQDSAIA